MSSNGSWFQATWNSRGARVNPRKAGWYAARPECCNITVKLFLSNNLLDCFVEGDDLKRDVYDFEWWYPLKSQHDRLPEFRG